MTAPSRVPLARTPDEQAEEDAFLALYGAWEPMDPPTFAREMEGFDRPGGSSAAGPSKPRPATAESTRTPMYQSSPATSPRSSTFMQGRWHVWNNVGGVLHPLGDRWPTVDEPAASCGFASTLSLPGSWTSR